MTRTPPPLHHRLAARRQHAAPRLLPLAAIVLALCGCGRDDTPTPPAMDMSSLDMSAADMPSPEDMPARFTRPVGATCDGPEQCVSSARCVAYGPRFVCMETCDELNRICTDGALCTALVAGTTAVCYPGGNVQPGQPCSNNLDCTRGHGCFGTASERYCMRACHLEDSPVCQTEQRCVPLFTTSGRGICRDRIGSPCAEDLCPDALTCSTTEAQARGVDLSMFFPGATCTRFGCTSDAECTNTSACRPLGNTGLTACLDRCEADAECRFHLGMRCQRGDRCDQTTDPETCRATLGIDRFCIGPAFPMQ